MKQAMPGKSMRDRMLALVLGQELDRGSFVMYDIMVSPDEALKPLGPGRIGLGADAPSYVWNVLTAVLRLRNTNK